MPDLSLPYRDVLEHVLDEAIERWHAAELDPDSDPLHPTLHDWLGLTWAEYAEYVGGGVDALIGEFGKRPLPAAPGGGERG